MPRRVSDPELFTTRGDARNTKVAPQQWRTTMLHNDRRAPRIAVLLSAMMMLALSACGRSDVVVIAAQPTRASTPTPGTAAAATSTTTAGMATVTPATTVTSEASGTAVSTTDTITATPTAGAPTPTAGAATATAVVVGDTDPFTGTDILSDTEDVSVTIELSGTQTVVTAPPVAIAIANAFTVPVEQVIVLHNDGLGFGEIARAYFLAQELAADGDITNDLTAEQILALHQGGQGWGQIVMTLGLPQGNSGRNLGLIMRAHGAPAQTTVVVVPTGGENDDHGPALVPSQPKQEIHGGNGKDKPHGNGNGHGKGNGQGNGKGKKTK